MLTPALERKIERSFAHHGLKPSWWKNPAFLRTYCHGCGKPLQWKRVVAEKRQRFVCTGCGRIDYINPKIVAGTLPQKNGRIYLLRRAIEPAHGLWTFPAGYMEMGESVPQAAVRETKEEICCQVKVSGNPKIYTYPDAAGITVVYPAFVVKGVPRPGVESLEVRAFSPEEIPWESLAFRSVFHGLRDWVKETVF